MSWNEYVGSVTQAFDEWKGTDRDIRAYLDLSQRWGEAAYRQTWDEAQEEFSRSFNPDMDDVDGHVDLFHEKVGGLWSKDFFWKVRAAALRDAVSAFEVYLEKSLNKLLQWYRFADEGGAAYKLTPERRGHQLSPSWPTLRKIHGALSPRRLLVTAHWVRADLGKLALDDLLELAPALPRLKPWPEYGYRAADQRDGQRDNPVIQHYDAPYPGVALSPSGSRDGRRSR
jgi:hypothetical protein